MARFRRYGKSRQLLLTSMSDLSNALALDSARWAATGAPVAGLTADSALLRHIDEEGDGRILAHELRSAISWTLATFVAGSVPSKTADIEERFLATDGPEAEKLRLGIRRILSRLGKQPEARLTLGELRELARQLSLQPVRGGILLPEATDDPLLAGFSSDVIRVTGGRPHPSGTIGLDADQAAAFVEGIAAYLDWYSAKPNPFGEGTEEAVGLLEQLAAKIDHYFLLTHVRRMDEHLLDPLLAEATTDGAMLNDPARLRQLLEGYPIAAPRIDGTLALNEVDNPLYADSITRLAELVVAPRWPDAGGALKETMWTEIVAVWETYRNWRATRPALSYDGIDPSLLERYGTGEEARKVADLAAAAEREEIRPEEIALVEKAILFRMSILRIANNFVSFPELYDPNARALFEVGSLVMDGRYFHLSVVVGDRAAHKAAAARSNMYVLYVAVRERQGSTLYEIAVPVTSGSVGNLGVGKRGIFLEIGGRELDAEVVEVIDNPVSLGEAIRAPFRRLAAAVETRVQAMGSAAEKQVATGSPRSLLGGANTAGLVAGGGVALAALGSAAAFVTGTLARLAWWKILVGLGAIAAAILLPAIIIAVIRLRRRDLSSILEASGWAINARMRLTRRLSRFFTQQPGRHYREPAIIARADDGGVR